MSFQLQVMKSATVRPQKPDQLKRLAMPYVIAAMIALGIMWISNARGNTLRSTSRFAAMTRSKEGPLENSNELCIKIASSSQQADQLQTATPTAVTTTPMSLLKHSKKFHLPLLHNLWTFRSAS